MIAILAATTAVVGLSFLLLPELSRPTVPLAVSIPSTRVDDPVVTTAVRQYRIGAGLAMVVAIGACLLLPRSLGDTGLAITGTVIPLLLVAVDVAILIRARRPILTAKNEQRWYEGVRVGTATTPLATSATLPRAVLAAFVVSLAILAVITITGVLRLPALPDPLPVHFGADGTADRWEPRSVWSVFGLHIIMTATVALLIGLGLIAHRSRRQHPDGRADLGRAEVHGRNHVVLATLAVAAVLIALIDGALSAAIWWSADPGIVGAVTGGTVVASLVICVVPLALAARMRSDLAGSAPGDTETPDDESHWRLGGQVYLNRDDPAVFVPKRLGVGYTVNLARPGGMVFMAAIGLVAVGSLVLAGLGATGVLG